MLQLGPSSPRSHWSVGRSVVCSYHNNHKLVPLEVLIGSVLTEIVHWISRIGEQRRGLFKQTEHGGSSARNAKLLLENNAVTGCHKHSSANQNAKPSAHGFHAESRFPPPDFRGAAGHQNPTGWVCRTARPFLTPLRRVPTGSCQFRLR